MRTKIAVVLSFFLLQSAFPQSSVVGHWEGSIKIQGQELIIKVNFKSEPQGLSATIDIPQQKAKDLPLKEVRYQPPTVHFELPAGPGLAVFDGERSDSSIAGKFTQAGIIGSFSLKKANESQTEVAEEALPKFKPIVGLWNGAIKAAGHSLGFAMTFKTKNGELVSTIDIREQNGFGIPLNNVRFDSSKVHCELSGGRGVAVFDGELSGDSVHGTFTQAGIAGTFHMVRGVAKEEVKLPEEPVPYKQEEVVFYNDTIKFAGTLTIPSSSGPHPAVVMITGSGPQNRDEELFGFKLFKVIADRFTRNGIAVLRYDDRGVGGSTGAESQPTSTDFAEDALAAIHFLQTRSDINPRQIGLCGHSEGGIVAPLAASQSKDVAFIICMAGTGVNGEKVILSQQEAIMRADSASDENIKKAHDESQSAFKLVSSGKDTSEIRAWLHASIEEDMKTMSEAEQRSIADKEEFLRATVEVQMKSLTSPWFKFFLTYDPLPALSKVKCPILALFGGRDLQVLADLNRNAMESALNKSGNKDYTFKVFPQANHLFLTANTGSTKEYTTLKKEFVPGFLDTMTSWVQKRVAIVK